MAGYLPSQLDAQTLSRLDSTIKNNNCWQDNPNIFRWVIHMKSFSLAELKSLPQAEELAERVYVVRQVFFTKSV